MIITLKAAAVCTLYNRDSEGYSTYKSGEIIKIIDGSNVKHIKADKNNIIIVFHNGLSEEYWSDAVKIEIDTEETATICGYNAEDLIMFAEICRRSGIRNEDMLSFVVDVKAALKIIQSTLHSEYVKTMMEALDKLK